jgi:uncharacterized protein (UPF0332 family)
MQSEILVYIEKSRENLEMAEIAFDTGKYNVSASRAYYSAFLAVVAVLRMNGFIIDSDSHKSVQSIFNGELIHRKKLFPSKYRRYLPDMLKLRVDADYGTIHVSKKLAKIQLLNSKEFVSELLKGL